MNAQAHLARVIRSSTLELINCATETLRFAPLFAIRAKSYTGFRLISLSKPFGI
jgi:hypothetical protein